MAGLRVSKNVILPRTDKVKDPETKRVIDELLRKLQEMNQVYHNDITYLESRVYSLEHP